MEIPNSGLFDTCTLQKNGWRQTLKPALLKGLRGLTQKPLFPFAEVGCCRVLLFSSVPPQGQVSAFTVGSAVR